MVKCCECGAETHDDINLCLECADKRTTINERLRALKNVKSLDSFGAKIDGTPDLREAAKRLLRD